MNPERAWLSSGRSEQNRYQRPLKRSIIVACVLFIVVQCMVLSVVNMIAYRKMLLRQYQGSLRQVLTMTALALDVEELERCMETGEVSPGYRQMQDYVNQVLVQGNLRSLMAVAPGDGDARYLLFAHRPELNIPERLNEPMPLPKETASLFRSAQEGEDITFFQETGQPHEDYSGLLPLRDAEGRTVALLWAEVDVGGIQDVQSSQAVLNIGLSLVIGAGFILCFMFWTGRNILWPIQTLESCVTEYSKKTDLTKNPDQLILDVPEFQTGNEVESLSKSVVKMSEKIRDAVVKIISTEQELARMNLLANKDGLTHVGNKNAYLSYMNDLQQKMGEEGLEFAILVADANGLKQINDTYGHEKGDLYLKSVCAVICEVFSHSPVFRIGGDEFVVILRNRDYQNRETLLAQAKAAFRKSYSPGAQPWEQVSAALGLGIYYEREDQNVEEVFNRADRFMYRNKVEMKAIRTL